MCFSINPSLSGSAASFIVMMLPPTSGRKAVRLRNAANITNISEIYAFLIATWIGTQTHRKKSIGAPPHWGQEFRTKLLGLADQIQLVDQMTGLAKWEGSIRGKWPVEEYESLVQTESQMIGALAQVSFFQSERDICSTPSLGGQCFRPP